MDTTIILAASTHQIDAIYTNQIMPVRGKPAIAWVIENNKSKKDTILVLSKDNLQTIEYI
ncbi:MAG: hypothetical protein PHI50_00205 [Alphaproteobacteria bacterium]|nr:hypothetical protein [Alphaproteobacteria bacterium]